MWKLKFKFPYVEVLQWAGTWWTGVDDKKVKERKRKRLIFLGLCRKPIKSFDTGLVSLTKAPGALSRRVKGQGAFLRGS